jgi:predicted DNA-binding transcriptional regulator YafY
MSKVSNCLRMIELLMARGKMKGEELAQELEVKERMIREYKTELEKAGIFVESDRGPDGGYYIERHTMFPVKNFSTKELEALNIAVRGTLSKKNSTDDQVLKIALDKVNAVQREGERNSRHFYFANNYLVNNEVGDESEHFKKLHQAFHHRQKVEIVYTAASTNETTKRIIHPYAFVVYDEFIYCIAFCEWKNDRRNFKVMRIERATILMNAYDIPDDFHIRQVLPDLGLVKDPFLVELIIHPPYSYKVKESIYSKNQQITDLKNGCIRFRAEMDGKESVKKWILGMGIHIEVVKPKWLQDEIVENLTKLLQVYREK